MGYFIALVDKGVVRRPLDTSVAGSEWVLVRRLKDTPRDMQPVLHRTQWYVDQTNRYAYEQILLLAFLCLTRKVKFTPILDRLLRSVLDNAAALLNRLSDNGREPMICSELVYRSYDEALPENSDIYSLRINELPILRNLVFAVPESSSGVVSAMGLTARGQGVHPQSLLALVASEPNRAWMMVEPDVLNLAALDRPAPSQAEVENLIEQYLEEVKSESHFVAPIEVPLNELRNSVHNFGLRLYEARKSPATTSHMAFLTFTPNSSIFQHLFQTASDFVTPGDMVRTQSLFSLGKLVR